MKKHALCAVYRVAKRHVTRPVVTFTDQYITLSKRVAEDQYASIRSALDKTLRPQGWLVRQVSLIAGARSLNEQDLRQNLELFKIPQASIETIRSKLAMKGFERTREYIKRHVQYEIQWATRRRRSLDTDSLGPMRTHASPHHLPLSLRR